MIRITAILLIILLAACTSRADWIAQWNSRCESYGFTRGTDAFAQCIKKIEIEARRAHSMTRGGAD